MAIAFVTSTTLIDTSTTTTSDAISFGVSVGDCIVVAVARGVTQAVGSVTDNGGNTYTLQADQTAAPRTVIFTTIATASAATITIHFTAGSKTTCAVAKYSGVGSIGANHGTNTGASTTTETITCTLANAANWAVAGLGHFAGATGNTPTQQNGNKRVSVDTSGSSIIDISINDNTGSTSVVNSNTFPTSTNTGAVFVELIPAIQLGWLLAEWETPNRPLQKPSQYEFLAEPVFAQPAPAFGWYYDFEKPLFKSPPPRQDYFAEPVFAQPAPAYSWQVAWDNPVIVRRSTQDYFVEPFTQTVAAPAVVLSWLLGWDNPAIVRRSFTGNPSPEFEIKPTLVVTSTSSMDPQVHLERLNKMDRTHRF